MVELTIPPSYSMHLPGSNMLCGANVKIHLTMVVFFVIEVAASLPVVTTYPLYCVLVIVVCGPIWLLTVLVHECGHRLMSRRILGEATTNEIILWPMGGYTFCDGLSVSGNDGSESMEARGNLKDDIMIALAGPWCHVPMGMAWFAVYALVNNGDVSSFTFRRYLTVISSAEGFFSTLCEQACLVNILLCWYNVFLPSYPLDGSRLMTSSMLLMGMALNKAALLILLVLILVSIALFAWSVASFADGVGITGILSIFVVIFTWCESYRVYSSIVEGRLREHPLFGRDCYIYRDARPSIFQLSTAARNNVSDDNANVDGEEAEHENMTVVLTETDIADRDDVQ